MTLSAWISPRLPPTSISPTKQYPAGNTKSGFATSPFSYRFATPGRWNAVRTLLNNTVGTLSGDNVQFNFVKKREDQHSGRTRDVDQASNACSSDSVALFSGGLDSFAGAVYLIQQGRQPLLASHYVSGLKGVQGRLVQALENRMDVKFEHFQYRITSGRSAETRFPLKTRESTHRARSFLFMSLAAVAAKVRGFSEIFICENGVLSLNVPISDARKGSRSTRHAQSPLLGPISISSSMPCTSKRLQSVIPFFSGQRARRWTCYERRH